jgi:plasmid stability protein
MGTELKRATIYFDPRLHRALRLRAAEMERSVSDLANEAVKRSLAEDAEDLAAFEARSGEPNLLFENVLKDMRKRGLL